MVHSRDAPSKAGEPLVIRWRAAQVGRAPSELRSPVGGQLVRKRIPNVSSGSYFRSNAASLADVVLEQANSPGPNSEAVLAKRLRTSIGGSAKSASGSVASRVCRVY